MATFATAQKVGIFGRLWSSYLVALRVRPIRTRMISGVITASIADSIAQFGFEKRSLIGSDGDKSKSWDALRTLRLCTYTGILFAPVLYQWLGLQQKVVVGGAVTTLLARLGMDYTIFFPFSAIYFPIMMGSLEGKSIDEIKQKIQLQLYPTWQRACLVFGPTQLVNLTLVPPQHRILMLQTVGLCWVVYLSWLNNSANKQLHEVA
ncbi:hypothetical protein BD324DRAFT_632587 [Kockovaella imperatae]|uniref:Uncharacterized protein n=1 Tax=Kockovaella imperatae TaxID=4999 RepID=A0A1Y1UBE7_9TREE|nr:hypothetical protein BD324DRAFT_632587 [Kockovaella imperatae]ORX35378.1 hypothetical protein BD324DRAFT_632587 [Kockovaella imperatae]